jgi:hypothetical protein
LDASTRLRIATRIHFALKRHFGEDVAVRSLLKNDAEAREALWVCEASGDVELTALARQFRRATQAEAAAAASVKVAAPIGRAPQETAWARDTSGFGVTNLPALDTAPAEASHSWFSAPSWLRRSPSRAAR